MERKEKKAKGENSRLEEEIEEEQGNVEWRKGKAGRKVHKGGWRGEWEGWRKGVDRDKVNSTRH